MLEEQNNHLNILVQNNNESGNKCTVKVGAVFFKVWLQLFFSVFYLKMYKNNIFYFLKIIFDTNALK
jgi:hypothetical protein